MILNIDELDPYKEWQNFDQHPELCKILADLQQHRIGFSDSVAYIRGERPDRSTGRSAGRNGQLFWSTDYTRAHLINALLRRGDVSVTELQGDKYLRVPEGKIYQYLSNANIVFDARPRKSGRAMDVDGVTHEVDIETCEGIYATVRIAGISRTLPAKWSATMQMYRLTEPLPPRGQVLADMVAPVVGISADQLRRGARVLGSSNSKVSLADLTALMEFMKGSAYA